MKFSILIGLLCVGLTSAFGQPTYKFKLQLDGYGKDDQINDAAVDVNGNIYVAGWIKNTSNEYDYLVAKFDRNGVLKWLQTYDNGNNDQAKSIAVQGSYLFITGKSQSGTDYDIASFVIDTGGTTVMSNSNVKRYDYNSLNRNDDAVKILPAGPGSNVFYVVGMSRVTVSTKYDVTILKYDAVLGFQGDSHYDSGDSDIVVGAALVPNSAIYVLAKAGSSNPNYLTVKYDLNIAQQWVKTYDNGGSDLPLNLIADTSGCYVTGTSYASCGDADVATIKYTPSGTQSWANRSYNCSSFQFASGGMAIDNNAVYAAGYHANGSQFFKIDKTTGVNAWSGDATTPSTWTTIRINGTTGDFYTSGTTNASPTKYVLDRFNSSGTFQSETIYDPSNAGGGGLGNLCVGMASSNNDSSLVLFGSTNQNTLSGLPQDLFLVKYYTGGTFTSRAAFVGGSPQSASDPNQYQLSQNYPNPFNPATKIRFTLREPGPVSLTIYDLLGREVRTLVHNEYYSQGLHEVDVNASDLASGTYFYRIVANNGKFQQVKKMLLMK